MSAQKYKLNKDNAVKIAKGAGIAMGGALSVYLLQLLPQIDFGIYTPAIVGIASILINAVREALKNGNS